MASDYGGNYDTTKLPEDLLMEIFLRSSVDALIRAKCVCKYWYGLIKDPNFSYKHLQYQKKTKKSRFLLQYFNLETQEHKYAVLNDVTQSSTTYEDVGFLHVNLHFLNLEGPVDGLYCLYDIGERIVLWNPALMDFKILPLPPPHFLPHYEVAFGYVGFGIDPLTNDHKVVLVRMFSNTLNNDDLVYGLFAAVYNLRTNTWRNIDLDGFPLSEYSFDNNDSSSFLDGTYHWWAVHGGDDDDPGVVLAFDMGNETFRVITGPNIAQFDIPFYYPSNTLAVYEERVALVRSDNLFVGIWVMLEEGIWIKQYSIGPLPGLVQPLGFWKKGGLFLVINDPETEVLNPNSKMILYDINTQEMKIVGPRATDVGFLTSVYYESLLSINGGTSCNGELHPWKRVEDFFNKHPCS